MASLTGSFQVGSVASVQSVRDAIESYRRAQYLVAGSTVVTASEASDFEADEETGSVFRDDEQESTFRQRPGSPATFARPYEFVGDFDWDEDLPQQSAMSHPSSGRYSGPSSLAPHNPHPMSAREDTPLLRKALSFSTPFDPTKRPRLPTPVSSPTLPQINEPRPIVPPSVPPALRRRQSAVSTKSVTYHYGGKSTFGQTLFNSIAILLGIGMLSEPLAFAYAGWGAGTLLIISYGFISCYTAKILARIILSDPRLRSYSDIGRKAFGPRSTVFISIMFCLELFAVSVILVTLYADSLHSIIPEYSSDAYKVCGLALLIPTVFLPLSLLSYTSILGIISTMFIVVVIVIDGFNKKEAPGSFWEPAETSFGIASMNKLGIAFGLFMAGFSGHAVIPSLARDMKDPSQFDRMINWAFVIATLVYTLIGWAGYAMFGSSVSEEISMDLLSTPGYDPNLNLAALWMLVISPLSKFALTTQPLNATLEILLGVDSLSSTTDARKSLDGCKPGGCFKQVVSTIQRLCMTILAVAVSIWVPQFSAMMAFLGSFSAFLLCVIGPITAKIALEGRCNRFDGFVLIIASIMAGWGTYAAFIAAEE